MEPRSRPPSKEFHALAEANALRAKRRYAEALTRYLEVVRSAPGSRQAVAARLAAATLLLEHRRDAQAAKQTLRPITTSSAAFPAALFLLARAHEATGEVNAAVRTLRRFTKLYGDHPLRRTAEKRLRRLDGAR